MDPSQLGEGVTPWDKTRTLGLKIKVGGASFAVVTLGQTLDPPPSQGGLIFGQTLAKPWRFSRVCRPSAGKSPDNLNAPACGRQKSPII